MSAEKNMKKDVAEQKVNFDSTLAKIQNEPIPDDDEFKGQFPCGLLWEGQVIRDFEFRDMDGGDEEALSALAKKGAKGMAKIGNKLLERCITRIGHLTPEGCGADTWRKVIQELTVPDQDTALVLIRKVSEDAEIETKHVCPACEENIVYVFNMDELEMRPYTGNDEHKEIITLPRGFKDDKGIVHREVEIRLPNGLDREITLPIAQQNAAKGSTLMLARLCKFTDGYPLSEYTLRQMKMKDRGALEKKNREMMDFGYKSVVEVECPECGTKFESNLSALGRSF